MSKVCEITGKKLMSGNNVSKSHNRTKRMFYPNIKVKKYFLQDENKWVKLTISASGMKKIAKVGLKKALEDAKQKGYITKY